MKKDSLQLFITLLLKKLGFTRSIYAFLLSLNIDFFNKGRNTMFQTPNALFYVFNGNCFEITLLTIFPQNTFEFRFA